MVKRDMTMKSSWLETQALQCCDFGRCKGGRPAHVSAGALCMRTSCMMQNWLRRYSATWACRGRGAPWFWRGAVCTPMGKGEGCAHACLTRSSAASSSRHLSRGPRACLPCSMEPSPQSVTGAGVGELAWAFKPVAARFVTRHGVLQDHGDHSGVPAA